MAFRSRIKVSANLSSRRKKAEEGPAAEGPTTVAPENTNNAEQRPRHSAANSYDAYALRRQAEIEVATAEREVADCLMLLKKSGGTCRAPFADVFAAPRTENGAGVNCSRPQQEAFGAAEARTSAAGDLHAFKHPRHVADHNADGGAVETAIEQDVIKMDLQKSPGRGRHRVKATPPFGQHRSSVICSAFSPPTCKDYATSRFECRERHCSGSSTAVPPLHFSCHKIATQCLTCIRSFSNSSIFDISSKLRKIEERHHRPLSRRDCAARFGAGVAEKSKLKIFDLSYSNPPINSAVNNTGPRRLKRKSKEKADFWNAAKKFSKPMRNTGTAMPVPQLRLDANGELVVYESSRDIETPAQQVARAVLVDSQLIQFDEPIGMNGFYRKQNRTKEWTAEETLAFFRALQRLGTDFSLMAELFPNRTRRELKLKFKKEERYHPQQINKALLHPKTFQIDYLKKQFEVERRQRNAAEAEWAKLKQAHGNPFKPVNGNRSTTAKALSHGVQVWERKNIRSTNISTGIIRAKVTNRVATVTTNRLDLKTHVCPNENSKPKQEQLDTIAKLNPASQLDSISKVIPIPAFVPSGMPKFVAIANPKKSYPRHKSNGKLMTLRMQKLAKMAIARLPCPPKQTTSPPSTFSSICIEHSLD